jgi:hypothetical protein
MSEGIMLSEPKMVEVAERLLRPTPADAEPTDSQRIDMLAMRVSMAEKQIAEIGAALLKFAKTVAGA